MVQLMYKGTLQAIQCNGSGYVYVSLSEACF